MCKYVNDQVCCVGLRERNGLNHKVVKCLENDYRKWKHVVTREYGEKGVMIRCVAWCMSVCCVRSPLVSIMVMLDRPGGVGGGKMIGERQHSAHTQAGCSKQLRTLVFSLSQNILITS